MRKVFCDFCRKLTLSRFLIISMTCICMSVSIISAVPELPKQWNKNSVWLLAAWTILPLRLRWIWLHHVTMTICHCSFLMKKKWNPVRVVNFCGLHPLTVEVSQINNTTKCHIVWQGTPWCLTAMFTVITSVIQRFKLVIKPHDKNTTHWADW